MLLRFVIYTFLMLASISVADDTANNSRIADNSILVLGDSLSAAYGIKVKQGWVALLRDRLENDNTKQSWEVVNASISGETTAGGVARLPKLIDDHKPVLCIIALGANDGLRGQSLSTMQSNIEQMIQMCDTTGTSLLLGMKLPPNYGAKYTNAFHEVYLNTAEQNDIPLVPFFLEDIALLDHYFQSDMLHPTAQAQEKILDSVWVQLERVLDKYARVQ